MYVQLIELGKGRKGISALCRMHLKGLDVGSIAGWKSMTQYLGRISCLRLCIAVLSEMLGITVLSQICNARYSDGQTYFFEALHCSVE